MSTDDFPVVEVVFDPAEARALNKAQVYFKADHTLDWYFVDMEPGDGSRLSGMLPKPLADTDRVEYYLFFLSGSFGTSQSQEYSVYVSDTGCAGLPPAPATASLTLHSTVPNQGPIPAGFSSQGISSLITVAGETIAVGAAGVGSGGVTSLAIGLVVGGSAAAAAGMAVSGGGDSGGESDGAVASPDAGQPTEAETTPTSTSPSPMPPSPPTSPAPPTMPSIPDVAGTWRINDRITESCIPSLVGQTSSSTMTIQQTGGSLTVNLRDPSFNANMTGTIDTAGTMSMMGQFVDDGDMGEIRVDATRTSSSDMTGSYSQFYPENGCTIKGTFTGKKN